LLEIIYAELLHDLYYNLYIQKNTGQPYVILFAYIHLMVGNGFNS
jgi:hypothetical protein